jgi:hypothetical protein
MISMGAECNVVNMSDGSTGGITMSYPEGRPVPENKNRTETPIKAIDIFLVTINTVR